MQTLCCVTSIFALSSKMRRDEISSKKLPTRVKKFWFSTNEFSLDLANFCHDQAQLDWFLHNNAFIWNFDQSILCDKICWLAFKLRFYYVA